MKQKNFLKTGNVLALKNSFRSFMAVIMLLLVSLQANAQEKETKMYVAVQNNTVATFYYDNLYDDRENDETEIWDVAVLSDRGLSEKKETIEKVVFDASFSDARPTSTYEWFYCCFKLNEIIGIENLNTSNVTNMNNMFYACGSLHTLDLSKFDTSNVWGMSGMFAECYSLTSFDFSNFDTSNVTDMSFMFYACCFLESLDVSNFNTSNVWSMMGMFSQCDWLSTIDLSTFDTSNVRNMSRMFSGCTSLRRLDLSNFNTSNVESMAEMFACCPSLFELNLSNFDTGNVWNMSYMFNGCNILKDIDLSSFDTSNVTEMDNMFGECSYLKSITIGEKFTRMPSFADCPQIKKVISLQKEPYAFNPECFSDEVKENAKLLVPIKTVALYADTEGWKEFKNILTKELDPEEENSGMEKDNIDENTDLYGNIVNNVYFNIAEGAGKYIEEDDCIVLTKATTSWNIDNSIGKDLFDEELLKNFTGMIFMLDAGSGTISIETETTGEMALGVKIGKDEPVIRKTDGKDMVTIDYSVAEPTRVYVYGCMSQASNAPGMRKANAEDSALKIYSLAWDKATGIGNIHGTTGSGTTIFNLNGQRVNTPGKGVYIVNGKKVILK